MSLLLNLPSKRHPNGKIKRLYRSVTYRDYQYASLLSLADITKQDLLFGKALDIEITQTASATGFKSKIEIPFLIFVISQTVK